MVEKDYRISYLLDYYGNILSETQKDAIDLYYNEDLSLAEIANHIGITRQGVRDAIKRGEETMINMEAKLGFAGKFEKYTETFEKIGEYANAIRLCCVGISLHYLLRVFCFFPFFRYLPRFQCLPLLFRIFAPRRFYE